MPRSAPIQFRDDSLNARLRPYAEPGEHLNQTSKRLLANYLDLLEASQPHFTEGEASLLVDALNGTLMEPRTARYLPYEIEDAIRGSRLGEKWSVDGPALLSRLRRMSSGDLWSLYQATRRYWQAEGEHEYRLRAVGLVKDELPL